MCDKLVATAAEWEVYEHADVDVAIDKAGKPVAEADKRECADRGSGGGDNRLHVSTDIEQEWIIADGMRVGLNLTVAAEHNMRMFQVKLPLRVAVPSHNQQLHL